MRFKAKLKLLDPEWPDAIWKAATAKNGGKGTAWLLPLAALAITGCRPASLEKGIEFKVIQDKGEIYIQAKVLGVKLIKSADGTPKRGQKEVTIKWRMSAGPGAEHDTHRPKELAAISKALLDAPTRTLTVRYDAEAISTRLRELSQELWPRRRYHVSGVCYRELVSAENKAAGVDPRDLAAAMSHLSTESQGRYASGRRRKGAVKPAKRTFTSVVPSTPVRADRSPMARFKRSSAIKKRLKA